MAKGNEAKEYVIKKIQDAFGEDFVGVFDKKAYVWSREDGGKMQVCINLTCPKAPVGEDSVAFPTTGGGLDFEAMDNMPAPKAPSTEISAAEQATIEELMKKLGL
jgi:hypothetical protein